VIAFVYFSNIYLVHPNGRGLRRLTYHGGLDPSFSPDGRRLAFVRAQASSSDLTGVGSGPFYTIDVDGAQLRALPGLGGICRCTGPAWSPSGRKIASSPMQQAMRDLSNSRYTVNANGTGRRNLLTAGQYGNLGVPDWEPLVATPVGR
jgi:Tol biopolymer transport system component